MENQNDNMATDQSPTKEPRRGYGVVNYDGTGMMEIQRIDAMGVFANDDEAVEQAIRDGYKVIPVEELPEGFDRRYLGWIDTPENRKGIQAYTNRHTRQGAMLRYLNEAALQLTRAGFDISGQDAEGFRVEFESRKLCTVTGKDIRYHETDVEGDRRAAFDKVLDITHTVGEYMRAMEKAPELKATGLQGDYRLLAEFNGIVLAGHKFTDAPGHQFVTWSRDHDGAGVTQGSYFNGYERAKKDFAARSGLVQDDRQFTDEQLAEMYRSIRETLDSAYPITAQRETVQGSAAEQIERVVPDLEQRVTRSNQSELEHAEQCEQGLQMG